MHWTAYLKTGTMVSDSRSEGSGRPKTFAVGNAEQFKCWDLAVPQLKKGAKARVSCPSSFCWGGAYTQAPLGGGTIPIDSDIDFELEIVDCNKQPEPSTLMQRAKRDKQPQTTTLQPSNCFYLKNLEAEHESTPLVLDCDENGCGLDEYVVDDKNQMLWWDKPSGEEWGPIAVMFNEWDVNKRQWLTAGKDNKLTTTSKRSSASNFFYEPKDSTLRMKHSEQSYQVTTEYVKKWASLEVSPIDDQFEPDDND